jgi:hypothetical protein
VQKAHTEHEHLYECGDDQPRKNLVYVVHGETQVSLTIYHDDDADDADADDDDDDETTASTRSL